jgi:glycosyltransferase involved in cell wall biosynthesis
MTRPLVKRPLVSVIIPVLNEEHRIPGCLQSVFDQTLPQADIEIVIVDGGSTDGTRQIVEAAREAHDNIHMVDDFGGSHADGLNAGIVASHGRFVARLDGHAEWEPDHLNRCLQVLERTGADNVGGTMKAVGDGVLQRAYGLATSSPLGAGGAVYRMGGPEQEVLTVYLGFFRRETLDRIGPFVEPHSDYELNERIRSAGGKIVFSPDLPTRYWPRDSVVALARQYAHYGRAKATVARRNPAVLRPYHLLPPLAVATGAAVALGIATKRGRRRAAAALAAYLLLCAEEGWRVSRGAPLAVRLTVPGVFPLIQASWGAGFWVGLFKQR